MIQGYYRNRFEIFIVAIVVGLIALIAIDRYSLMIKDARALRLEIISHHFMTAAANMRAEFLVSQVGAPILHQSLLVGEKLVYMSDQGWPLSTSIPEDQFRPTDEDCSFLWVTFLQNPAPIIQGQFSDGKTEYRAFAHYDHCRYGLIVDDAYFDYYPVTGRLLFSPLSP
ncbi:MAG: hypothetical protein AAGC78_02080 [Cellvibrio sp.]|uniref:hypothetical protein n=1 Tax=Cellvibrio sp. TaxID=1965322 RepID=UPI0031ABC06B